MERAELGPVGRALERSLKAVKTEPADAATVALARRMALEVDAGSTPADKAGSVLIRCLVELGMTPKARLGVTRGGEANDGGSDRKRALDELRKRRERRRVDDSSAVD